MVPSKVTGTLTFRPGHPEFTQDPEGLAALNLWRPRLRPVSDADVQPFLDHVKYLVPKKEERERFLETLRQVIDFLASGLIEGTLRRATDSGVTDPDATYTMRYDGLGRMTAIDNAGSPGQPHVVLDYRYDSVGSLLQVGHSVGGAAAYAAWASLLPPDVELYRVQLPGRENRLREAPFAALTPLVEVLAKVLRPQLDLNQYVQHSPQPELANTIARLAALRRARLKLPPNG